MSAILPVKKPPSSRPSLSLTPALKSLSLSLSVPANAPSRYGTSLNGPEEDDPDDGEGDRKWGANDKGVRERMAGELKDVIRGPHAGPVPGLEDELSGRTRRFPNGISQASSSNSIEGMAIGAVGGVGVGGESGSSSASGNGVAVGGVTAVGGVGALMGGEPLEKGLSSDKEKNSSALDVQPSTLKDLGRLGEGASGEVRRVLHLPSGIVMAKKVGLIVFSILWRDVS